MYGQLQELKDRRTKLLSDAQAILLRAEKTPEQRESVKKMLADCDVLETRISDLDLSQRIDREERQSRIPPRGQPGDASGDLLNSSDPAGEKRAFKNFVTRGIVSAPAESRDLGTVTGGSIGAGSQLVPQAFYPVLTQAQLAWGKIVGIVKQFNSDTGAPMKAALANDTGQSMTVLGEAIQVSESDPTLSGTLTQTDILSTGVIKASLGELQDSAFDIDQFVRNLFGVRYYRGLSCAIINGSSSGNIASIITGATLGTTGTGSNTSITYAEIVAMFSALDPAYIDNGTWVFNSTTRGVLLAITDTLGRPLYIPNPTTGALDQLLGRPVVISQHMPNPTSALYPLLFGDFQEGYLLRTAKPGLVVARLNERYMDTLEVGFIGYCRAGGISTDAGTHPILKYKMKT